MDAKIGVVRAKAARSRVAAVLANEDLDQHRRWFERQRSLSLQAARERRQRRVRERDAEVRRKRTEARALRVRSLGVGLSRGAVSALTALCTRLWQGVAWAGESVVSGLASLRLRLGHGLARTAASAISGLALLGVRLLHAVTGITATGRAYGLSCIRGLSTGGARFAAQARAAGLSCAEGFERIGARISSQLNDRGQSIIRSVRQKGEALRQRRRDAATARSRAEHERLQTKIHALGKAERSRRAKVMPAIEPEHPTQQPEPEGWAELRQLAKSRRGLEMQDRNRRAVTWHGSDPRISGSTLWSRSERISRARSAPPPSPECVPAGKAGSRLDGLANVIGIGTVSHRLR